MDVLTAITPDRARDLTAGWERDGGAPACLMFRTGSYSIDHGEHLCAFCRVPQTIHRAYQLIARPRVHA